MLKFWIFLTFLVTGLTANDSFEWSSEYDTPFDSISEEGSDVVRTTKSDTDNVPEAYYSEIFEDGNYDSMKQLNDYQEEDNRSVGKDDKINERIDLHDGNVDESFDLSSFSDPDKKSLSQEINDEIYDSDDDVVDIPASEEAIQKILNDTKSILLEDTQNDFEEYSSIKDEANKNITETYKDIIEETKALIEQIDGTLDEKINESDDTKDLETNTDANDDNIKSNDLIADLVELNEIKNKLSNVDDKFGEENEDIMNYDEKDYEELNDDNLDQIFDENDVTRKKAEVVKVHKVEPLSDDSDSIFQNMKLIHFQNDDLPADDIEPLLSEIKASQYGANVPSDSPTEESSTENIMHPNPKDYENILDTKNLTDAQVDLLLIDFSDKNLKRIQSEVKSARNVQRIWLSVDEPTVITSPGYPNPYPTNSITDWIVEGIGTGIEFNVTDCAINGHVGDYLLVKPGRADDSGQDGLLFTYTLNTERNYRFLDVDRMFMRFEAKIGMQYMRGFSISAKMLVSAPSIYESEPEPEPEVSYVDDKITLNLGGISLDGFMKIEEQFRQIVADMATMYINANNISTTVNNTLDATQITSRGLCFHNWPKYEMCAEVQFGVPLIMEEGERPRLDEEDLHTMWLQYSTMDPFATRLRMLGITEFQVPNDHGVLLVWLVIAGGVVISMVMLAFALWRFSCFEDYSRMPPYSDTDSVCEKRKLDMFPTPHQALPPLFSDDDYKWADSEDHKVNVGYSNRNFLQDDMFDIDSDDDVLPERNRYTTDV
ncbi:uncharacterized protein LOC121728295 isoform X2 [Aricia agestis]|uniref:uncharacterized protein LOC121728295 isoform X2 n=1 Tax=Aricia agestis TaxID=91739 RepID=UPI001C20A3B1|nr:uncharacterized protein LOC121728295 isoform X2 [Aricia agestis]